MRKILLKITSLALCFVIMALSFSFASFASDEVLTIENGELKQYSGSDTVYKIPSSVSSIAEDAFTDCSSLKEIIVPESVKNVGSNAFSSCNNLKAITFIGSQDIVINNDIANKNVLFILNNNSRSKRKAIATNGYNWCSYELLNISGKKILSFNYGATKDIVSFEGVKEIINSVSPNYVLFSDANKYYLSTGLSANEIDFSNPVNPGIVIKINLAIKTWNTPDKESINSGNDGAKNGIKYLLNSLLKAFK